jgi:hypothetical protein
LHGLGNKIEKEEYRIRDKFNVFQGENWDVQEEDDPLEKSVYSMCLCPRNKVLLISKDTKIYIIDLRRLKERVED